MVADAEKIVRELGKHDARPGLPPADPLAAYRVETGRVTTLHEEE